MQKPSSRQSLAAVIALAGIFQGAANAKDNRHANNAPGLNASCADAKGKVVSLGTVMSFPVTLSIDAKNIVFKSANGRSAKGDLSRHACAFSPQKGASASLLDIVCIPRNNLSISTSFFGSTEGKINQEVFDGKPRHPGVDTWLALTGTTRMVHRATDETGAPVERELSGTPDNPIDPQVHFEREMECTITSRPATAPAPNPAPAPSSTRI